MPSTDFHNTWNTVSAESVARYLLLLADQTGDCVVTHMQLQKWLYYVQGWSLAVAGKPLFNEEIQAWKHGPVIKSLWPKFTDYGKSAIAPHECADDGTLTDSQRQFVEWVWSRYNQYSALKLSEMTHREPPWINARAGLPSTADSNKPITIESLRDFFSKQHEAECRKLGIDQRLLRESIQSARKGDTAPLSSVL